MDIYLFISRKIRKLQSNIASSTQNLQLIGHYGRYISQTNFQVLLVNYSSSSKEPK